MSFPQTPLKTLVEIELDGVWTNITPYVIRDPIEIVRGRADEAGQVEPSVCTMTLNNRDGRFSPRNPMSPYYGILGRNTPIRIQTAIGVNLLTSNQSSMEIDVSDWHGGSASGTAPSVASSTLHPQDGTDGLQVSWATSASSSYAYMDVTGLVTGRTYTLSAYLYVPTGDPDVRMLAGYFSTTSGTWNPATGSLMSTKNALTRASVTFTVTDVSDGAYRIGVQAASSTTTDLCFMDAVQLEEAGSASTYVLPPDSFRFTGEVSAWPQRWDKTGTDIYVPLEASGIMRRLNQSTAIQLPAYKDYLISTNPHSYWPLDDKAKSASGKNEGVANTNRFRISATGNWAFGKGDLGEVLPPGLSISAAAGGGAPIIANSPVDMFDAITAWAFDFVYKVDTMDDTWGWQIYGSGNDRSYLLNFRVDGTNDDIQLQFVDIDETTTGLGNTGVLQAVSDGDLHHIRLSLAENGANVDWTIYVDGTSQASGTQNSQSVRGMGNIYATYIKSAETTPLALGHVAIWNVGGSGDDPPDLADIMDVLSGYDGETAADRMERICTEADIPFTLIGTAADTVMMGPQPNDRTPLEILRDCEATDKGILFEPRDSLTLAYRTRVDLYNQAVALELDYSAAVFSEVPEPVDDDRLTRNDVTVSRDGGGSARATLESGPLSIQDPPDGVGVYQYSETANVYADEQLPDLAAWIMNLGTIDKSRYPTLPLNLAREVFASDSDLSSDAATLDVGDLIQIINLPDWLPPDDVVVLAQGFRETFSQFEWLIDTNTAPADLYLIPEFEAALPPEAGNERARFDSEGATLASGIDDNDTSLTVDTTWTAWTPDNTEDGFDVMIGGEQMTVTDITALSGDDHTFTVTRSVNGIVKSHSAGAEVRLFYTPTFGL